jgi:translation elongation factor EF-G
MEFIVAAVSALTAVVVAVIEKRTRRDEDKWQQNADEHAALVNRMDSIGASLGRSLDRVEKNLGEHITRIENKIEQHDEVLFGHLASHAEAAFMKEAAPIKRRRAK